MSRRELALSLMQISRSQFDVFCVHFYSVSMFLFTSCPCKAYLKIIHSFPSAPVPFQSRQRIQTESENAAYLRTRVDDLRKDVIRIQAESDKRKEDFENSQKGLLASQMTTLRLITAENSLQEDNLNLGREKRDLQWSVKSLQEDNLNLGREKRDLEQQLDSKQVIIDTYLQSEVVFAKAQEDLGVLR